MLVDDPYKTISEITSNFDGIEGEDLMINFEDFLKRFCLLYNNNNFDGLCSSIVSLLKCIKTRKIDDLNIFFEMGVVSCLMNLLEVDHIVVSGGFYINDFSLLCIIEFISYKDVDFIDKLIDNGLVEKVTNFMYKEYVKSTKYSILCLKYLIYFSVKAFTITISDFDFLFLFNLFTSINRAEDVVEYGFDFLKVFINTFDRITVDDVDLYQLTMEKVYKIFSLTICLTENDDEEICYESFMLLKEIFNLDTINSYPQLINSELILKYFSLSMFDDQKFPVFVAISYYDALYTFLHCASDDFLHKFSIQDIHFDMNDDSYIIKLKVDILAIFLENDINIANIIINRNIFKLLYDVFDRCNTVTRQAIINIITVFIMKDDDPNHLKYIENNNIHIILLESLSYDHIFTENTLYCINKMITLFPKIKKDITHSIIETIEKLNDLESDKISFLVSQFFRISGSKFQCEST